MTQFGATFWKDGGKKPAWVQVVKIGIQLKGRRLKCLECQILLSWDTNNLCACTKLTAQASLTITCWLPCLIWWWHLLDGNLRLRGDATIGWRRLPGRMYHYAHFSAQDCPLPRCSAITIMMVVSSSFRLVEIVEKENNWTTCWYLRGEKVTNFYAQVQNLICPLNLLAKRCGCWCE